MLFPELRNHKIWTFILKEYPNTEQNTNDWNYKPFLLCENDLYNLLHRLLYCPCWGIIPQSTILCNKCKNMITFRIQNESSLNSWSFFLEVCDLLICEKFVSGKKKSDVI